MMTVAATGSTRHIDQDFEVFSPPILASRAVTMVLLDEIVGYLNRGALFRDRWRLQPEAGENDRDFAVRALDVFQERMRSIRHQDLLAPQVAYGYFPVNRDGDHLIFWEDDTRHRVGTRVAFRRQSEGARRSVVDYFKPVGEPDYAAVQFTTMGSRLSSRTHLLYAGEMRQSYESLYALGLALLEAFDEYWHRRVRYEWGFGFDDGPSLNLVLDGYYRGARFSLLEHLDGAGLNTVAGLVNANQIGIAVSGSGTTLQPELTAASLIAQHPQAAPFTTF